jgi:hypothetical protein
VGAAHCALRGLRGLVQSPPLEGLQGLAAVSAEEGSPLEQVGAIVRLVRWPMESAVAGPPLEEGLSRSDLAVAVWVTEVVPSRSDWAVVVWAIPWRAPWVLRGAAVQQWVFVLVLVGCWRLRCGKRLGGG